MTTSPFRPPVPARWLLPALLLFPLVAGAQDLPVLTTSDLPLVVDVEPQPVVAGAARLVEALAYLGNPLPDADAGRLEALLDQAPGPETTREVQRVLDAYCLALVEINPEGRVKVVRGPAEATLIQGGWTSFLIKVHNQAGVTARLDVHSPNAAPLLHRSTGAPRVAEENVLTSGQVAVRFLELSMYRNRPLNATLSGLELEYAVLQVYSKDAGRREARIGFNTGPGSQDIGFRDAVDILFDARPTTRVVMDIKDEDGTPMMASFVITDGIDRFAPDSVEAPGGRYRLQLASLEYRVPDRRLTGIYPLPSRRVAATDPYPDFFFHPQVYRSDGEHVDLPPGHYRIDVTRGPEYLPRTYQLILDEEMDSDSTVIPFRLHRWINMAELGWYSSDHHVHAAGCSHYESPEEGVQPESMWRQVQGEDLNVASVLAWGPCWYYQKQFFTGETHPLSNERNIMRYDVEVSGFPSSHAGHVVLMQLTEDDYPGTDEIEDWPTWTLPVMEWAREQGGLTGYAHSGWGLEPDEPTDALPNYAMPKMDGIGANEYIVTVTQDAVDFYSAGDTPAPWELNMWYHALNNGFRTRLSGETDFPCIYDERVGQARSYVRLDSALDYEGYIDALRAGRSYVSDGRAHLIDFTVDGVEMGTGDSELALDGPRAVTVTARAAVHLPLEQDEAAAGIAARPLTEQPYWHVERARIGTTRRVPVELIVNGVPVETQEIEADGSWNDLEFTVPVERSSWMALRVYPSAHTNPVFVLVDGQSVRVKESAEWARRAVDRCWTTKAPQIRAEERPAAEAAYNRARAVYDRLIREASER